MPFPTHRYFKEPADQAWKEFVEWAQKWLLDDVESGAMVLVRRDRSAVFTLSPEGGPIPTKAQRLKILEEGVKAIISHAPNSYHQPLKTPK